MHMAQISAGNVEGDPIIPSYIKHIHCPYRVSDMKINERHLPNMTLFPTFPCDYVSVIARWRRAHDIFVLSQRSVKSRE